MTGSLFDDLPEPEPEPTRKRIVWGCDQPKGCCTCCGGGGSDFGCGGMCWECRGTGHPHEPEQP